MSRSIPSLVPPAAAHGLGSRAGETPWGDIVQQLGAEIAGPLSHALERIQQLISTGQIDRQGLRALRESVAQAREAGMVTQQLARLASGRLRLSRERVHLTQVLRGLLAQRSRETQARGIQIRQLLQPIEVMSDAPLLFSLLNAVMDWALINTHSSLEMRLDTQTRPSQARWVCRFAHRSLDLGSAPAAAIAELPESLTSLKWRLIEQTAAALGVQPLREDEAGITRLTLTFSDLVSEDPHLVAPAVPAHLDRDDPLPSHNSKPLAGCHLLIVSPRRELRQQILASIRHMGLIVDAVPSMHDALRFCEEGLPHGITFEQSLRDADFDRLHAEITAEVPHFAFIEVREAVQQTQLSTATDDRMARISRANLTDALSSVLLFELSKAL